jgi:outer membrane receptor protein involved in Fe transport
MLTRYSFPIPILISAAALLAACPKALADGDPPPEASPPISAPTPTAGPNVTLLPALVVNGDLDQARSQILPNLGATAYSLGQSQIDTISEGDDAPFNQVILRAPGVAEDSAVNGDLHVRGEHANLQYRIDGVLLPEGITGFGLELDPRFVSTMQLITGSLPAQYGFRTAGVIDITTKNGALDSGGDAEVYAGSYDTVRSSFEAGGASGSASGFIDGSVDHNDLGIENPAPSATPVHDSAEEYKLFASASYVLDPSSRVTVLAGGSSSQFQVPDTPGLPAGTSPDGQPWLPGSFNSAGLNERQDEENDYLIAAYQKASGDLNYQVAGYGRYSAVHFMPDPVGDLYFNGVATDVDRAIRSGGFQADGSYSSSYANTIRAGLMVLNESLTADTTTAVFPVDGDGDPTGAPFSIVDDGREHALFLGAYLQDAWKVLPSLTVNAGARLDSYRSSFDREGQLSPRINVIDQAGASTVLHAGYARYFTPPPLENVPASTVATFNGTSNASPVTQDDPVTAERSDYFDAGISQTLAPGLQVGVDGYYKTARQQLDDGLFGQSLILSAFNYRKGKVDGLEFTSSFTRGGFSAYANVAWSKALGEDWDSAQFLFSPNDLAYVQNHWIFLDHDQSVTTSTGMSYVWKEGGGRRTLVYVDALTGGGLRQNGGGFEPNDPSAPIPNGATVPSYYEVNIGAEQAFRLGDGVLLKVRLDVVNLTDEVYELRSGTGVGVNAAQYGMRRGFFGSVALQF